VFLFEDAGRGHRFLVAVAVHTGEIPVIVGQDLDAVGCDLAGGNSHQGRQQNEGGEQ